MNLVGMPLLGTGGLEGRILGAEQSVTLNKRERSVPRAKANGLDKGNHRSGPRAGSQNQGHWKEPGPGGQGEGLGVTEG